MKMNYLFGTRIMTLSVACKYHPSFLPLYASHFLVLSSSMGTLIIRLTGLPSYWTDDRCFYSSPLVPSWETWLLFRHRESCTTPSQENRRYRDQFWNFSTRFWERVSWCDSKACSRSTQTLVKSLSALPLPSLVDYLFLILLKYALIIINF